MNVRKTGVFALALLFAGCGTTAEPGPPGTGSPTSQDDVGAGGEAESEPAPDTGEWERSVAAERVNVDDVHSDWDDAACSVTTILVDDAADCKAYLVAMTFTAEATALSLSGVENPPPGAQDTIDAAKEAAELGQAVDCPGDNCGTTAMSFMQAWDDLRGALAGW